jgi:hypothetical protein
MESSPRQRAPPSTGSLLVEQLVRRTPDFRWFPRKWLRGFTFFVWLWQQHDFPALVSSFPRQLLSERIPAVRANIVFLTSISLGKQSFGLPYRSQIIMAYLRDPMHYPKFSRLRSGSRDPRFRYSGVAEYGVFFLIYFTRADRFHRLFESLSEPFIASPK